MGKVKQMDQLIEEIDELIRIYETDIDWESKYDLIFYTHKETIHPLCNDIGMNFDWYDPDTSYEEDVRSYMEALKEFQTKLKKTVPAKQDRKIDFNEYVGRLAEEAEDISPLITPNDVTQAFIQFRQQPEAKTALRLAATAFRYAWENHY